MAYTWGQRHRPERNPSEWNFLWLKGNHGAGRRMETGDWGKCSSLSRVWLCDPTDCSPPGSFVCGILQARLLEWIAILCSRGSSPPRDRSWVSLIAGRFFTLWATGKTGVNWPLVPVLGSLILWWGRGGWGSVASWEWFCDFVTRPSPVVFVCVRSELSPTCENGSDDREWREEAVRLSYWVPEEEDD